MTDPNAPGTSREDLPEGEDSPPPEKTDQHDAGRGAGRKSNVQRPPEDQRGKPDPKEGA